MDRAELRLRYSRAPGLGRLRDLVAQRLRWPTGAPLHVYAHSRYGQDPRLERLALRSLVWVGRSWSSSEVEISLVGNGLIAVLVGDASGARAQPLVDVLQDVRELDYFFSQGDLRWSRVRSREVLVKADNLDILHHVWREPKRNLRVAKAAGTAVLATLPGWAQYLYDKPPSRRSVIITVLLALLIFPVAYWLDGMDREVDAGANP